MNPQYHYDNWKAITEGGYATGHNFGFRDGHHLGICEAIIRRHLPEPRSWPYRILYVTSGKGLPYSPLDQGIIDTLEVMADQLETVFPDQDVAQHAIQFQPDLILILDGTLIPVEKTAHLKSCGFRMAVWFTDDPYYTDVTAEIAGYYDDVFTLEYTCVSFYQELGCKRVHYLPLGVDAEVFRPRYAHLIERRDICFVGSGYWNRVYFFDKLAPYLSKKDFHINGIWWDRLSSFRLLERQIELNKWMEPEETATYYSGSKLVINLHRSYDDESFNKNSRKIKAVSPNPRTFEISACGVLQITDIRDDLSRFYTPGLEIVTYGSAEELKEKLEYYLAHEEESKQIAYRALRRTMREHTFTSRIEQMFNSIFSRKAGEDGE